MADDLHLNPLTGHHEFDSLIAAFSELRDAGEMELARQHIWERCGSEAAVFETARSSAP